MISLVSGSLWRGPRPQPTDYATVKAHFATVISLEGVEEDRKEAVELSPVRVISMPISDWPDIYWSGITQEYLNEILEAIVSALGPTLVHCQWGRDRTGLVVAAYRVRVCGWSKDRAWAEALQYGYRRWLNFGLNKTWADFA
jgi:tyrosine-protein phosphatase SIW14